MRQMGRPSLSAAQKADLRQRWKQGQSLSEIGRALGKHARSISWCRVLERRVHCSRSQAVRRR